MMAASQSRLLFNAQRAEVLQASLSQPPPWLKTQQVFARQQRQMLREIQAAAL